MRKYNVDVLYYEGDGDTGDITFKDIGSIRIGAKNVKEATKKVHKNLHIEATVPKDELGLFKKKENK